MITPIFLAGGSGTRLWPLSRQSFPKQFTPLARDPDGLVQSLFQAAARRFSGPGFGRPLVVTGEPFRFVAAAQMGQAGLLAESILIEPSPRNTAPAALAALLWLEARGRAGGVVLISPADHAAGDGQALAAAVQAGAGAARAGKIVTIGVTPDRPETGYGWLEPSSEPCKDTGLARPLARFVEKPDACVARAMLAGGRHLWNAGLFLARADVLLAAFRAQAPGLEAPVAAALEHGVADLGFFRLAAEPWAELGAISVDHAVMEGAAAAGQMAVVAHDGPWSDLGGWEAVWRTGPADGHGVVTHGNVTALDCSDSLLRSGADGVALAGLGLKDLVVVAEGDAVLVADRARAAELGQLVDAMRAAGVTQGRAAARDHRPWGWFEVLVEGPGFKVKRIRVTEGGVLSLQSHAHRAEHWVVVEGVARVTIDAEQRFVTANQSVYVPRGARHRLENPGDSPVTLIEVQTGADLSEDDILRHEDVYHRPNGQKLT